MALANRFINFIKKNSTISEIIAIVLVTVPAFISILNNGYFSMHDDQHIARLYLLDQGIKQGVLYPRWVGLLGFNYGYPLFNFYPPLIYYLGELFHLVGFSLIWSVKLVFISGFIISAYGMYLFLKGKVGRSVSVLGAVLYTYFFYHAVTSFVRGALAEFFSMAILPFVFLAIDRLASKQNLKNILFLGIAVALLMLNHPLIAFPSVIYIGFYFIFWLVNPDNKNKLFFAKNIIYAGLLGLFLSAFFWVPSIMEKKFTFVDDILTKELASYKIHYVSLFQLYYSPWGYGGSVAGTGDGMTFQLGKVYILLLIVSVILSFVYYRQKKRLDNVLKYFYFSLFLLFFSLFMTTSLSSFIWDNIKYLWYLQFPWRFLTFAGFFISVTGAFSVYFFKEGIVPKINTLEIKTKSRFFTTSLTLLLSLIIIYKYSPYFRPQILLDVDDEKLTGFSEIAWRVSRTSFEFVPKGIKTAKSSLNTTVLDIDKESLQMRSYEPLKQKGTVDVINDRFNDKEFIIDTQTPQKFIINTYNFPGWQAYLDGKRIAINDNNDLKLITINIPEGNHDVRIRFTDTPVRIAGNWLSAISLLFTASLFFLGRRRRNKK